MKAALVTITGVYRWGMIGVASEELDDVGEVYGSFYINDLRVHLVLVSYDGCQWRLLDSLGILRDLKYLFSSFPPRITHY